MKNVLLQRLNKRYVLIAGIALLLVLLFSQIFKYAFFVALSLATSFLINRIKIRQIGIEFVTLASVYAGYNYGRIAGLITALVLILFHLMISGYVGIFYLWVVPIYAAAGYASAILVGWQFSTVGVVLGIVINVAYLLCTLFFTPGRLPVLAPYAISNVIFNIFIFSVFF